MGQWDDRLNSHPLQNNLTALEERFKEIRQRKDYSTYSDFFVKGEAAVGFIRARVRQADPLIVSGAALDTVNNNIVEALNQTVAFLQDNNAVHITHNFNAAIEEAIRQSCLVPALSTRDDAHVLTDLAVSYRVSTETIVKQLAEAVEAVKKESNQSQNEIQQQHKRIEEQKGQLESQKARLDGVITQYQQQFSQGQQDRQTQFNNQLAKAQTEADAKLKELDKQFKTTIQAIQEQQKKAEDSLTENANKILAELKKNQKEASDLVHIIGNIGVTGNYQKIADEEKKTADQLRNYAIVFMTTMVLFIAFTVVMKVDGSLGWEIAIFRLLAGLIFAIPGTYCAVESSKHRKYEIQNRRIELELASLDPYLEKLDPAKRAQLKGDLAMRYFGQEIHDDGDNQISPTNWIDLLKSAIEALGKKGN